MEIYAIILVLIFVATAIIYIGIALSISFSRSSRSSRHLSPEERGDEGEEIVQEYLRNCMCPQDVLLKNVIIENKHFKSSTQIDHILITARGVFVIETKNFSGRIYGSTQQRSWTHVLKYGKEKYQFYSPVLQNQTHINILKQYLSANVSIHNLIVFVQNNTEYIDSAYVCPLKELRTRLNEPKPTLSEQQILQIRERIQEIRSYGEDAKHEHIQNIQEKRNLIASNRCPRCGAELVLRQGKYSNFYGCRNYPKCKYTKKL